MKKILGLDLGTNSIGWALTNNDFDNKNGNIEGLGSRIIPMSHDVLGKFDNGVSISQTAQRTEYRGKRRLVQRFLLRRERLHRVLNIIGFLPPHYSDAIDFDKKLGQFKPAQEEKISFSKDKNNKSHFLFINSYQEMLSGFKISDPNLKQLPFDLTIYYLRKKALTEKISKEELAWILLNFNQKRGYYQLRGEEEVNTDKKTEILSLKVVKVEIGEKDLKNKSNRDKYWYNVHLENNLIYKVSSFKSLEDWVDCVKEFLITSELNEDGTIKNDKMEDKPKVRLSILPSFEEIDRMTKVEQDKIYSKIKIKTEKLISDSDKTVGTFIYDTIFKNPTQKINGKLVRTIERKYYKDELSKILKAQIEFHSDILTDKNLYKKCIDELYKHNDSHKNNIKDKSFDYLFLDDIIFYQRPLKSKTSLISDCSLEFRPIKDKKGFLIKDVNGNQILKPLKCIAKSNPIYQEFRLLQFIKNLQIYKKQTVEDINVSNEYLQSEKDLVALFDFLNDKKEIDQISFIKYLLRPLNLKGKLLDAEVIKFRWNFVEDKIYPCNETRNQFLNAIAKTDVDKSFFDEKNTPELWHILYSVTDKKELYAINNDTGEQSGALTTFAKRHNLPKEFILNFSKIKPYKKDYGSFSEKAIKKLLSLMRFGDNWFEKNIDTRTLARIDKIQTGEFDENMRTRVREKAIHLSKTTDFQGLPLWLASYIIYDRHSEASDVSKWKSPEDIAWFLNPKNKLGFKQHSLRNPIVEQIITETLRVVKDIWQYYGEGKENFFDEIHIELGREMKNNAADRKRITENINQNENTNLRIKAILTELKNDGVNDVRPYSPSQIEILKIYEEGVYSKEDRKEKLDEIDKIRKNAKPTTSEINKYKLWLEQGYISPYTGKLIPLSDLFTTKYQIEHIIPQSRLFDDSLSNKVICESEVNELKSNMTSLEFILKNEDRIVTLTGGKIVKIFTKEAYNQHITSYYAKNKNKQKRLLSEEIPEKFIDRQLNDTKYISKIVKNLLSKIVRDEDEQEVTSKHIVSLNGSITSRMKQDWGLNDVWNNIITPRFERLNEITNSSDFGKLELKKDAFGNTGKQVFQTAVPDEISQGFSKKRIDHRHHALDALVIACVTKDHINYLNSINSERTNYSLVSKLRRTEEVKINEKTQKAPKEFHKPWGNFTKNAENQLNQIIISFKQNTRVINKTVNKYESYKDEHGNLNINENGLAQKQTITQTKGDNWAIRKPLHKETVSGIVFLKRVKQSHIPIANAIENVDLIVDKEVKKQLKERIKLYPNNNEGLKKHLKAFPIKIDGKIIDKIQVYEILQNATATRKTLDTTFDKIKISKITDTGIQTILLNHLKKECYQNLFDENNKPIPAHVVAFPENGIDELNKNISNLNNNKNHQPIKKVRLFEESSRFPLIKTDTKQDKFVDTASGTNLFFAIYRNENSKRDYKTIPLNEIIENQKLGALEKLKPNECSVPKQYFDEKTKEKFTLLFYLNPNDLVFVPNQEEIENPDLVTIQKFSKEQTQRIYKFTDSSDTTCNFIPASSSSLIFSLKKKEQEKLGLNFPIQDEYGLGSPQSKNQNSITGVQIKAICWKLEIDRIGKIKKIIK